MVLLMKFSRQDEPQRMGSPVLPPREREKAVLDQNMDTYPVPPRPEREVHLVVYRGNTLGFVPQAKGAPQVSPSALDAS